MISNNDHQRINELLDELGELLDPTHGRSEVLRAYTTAQNSVTTSDAASAAFSALAAKLQIATDLATAVAVALNPHH